MSGNQAQFSANPGRKRLILTLFTLQIPLRADKLSQSSVYLFDNARGDRFMNDFAEKRDYY
ncbi:MAG: hypothetical protein KZQ82_20330, partial [Candidatus Thiodiazotropha sp. (ex Lucinoma annulata)]|nr:hypothetical protein [Candidatus Thiodiazotropha sp. (ex Lucinoma annulata)]